MSTVTTSPTETAEHDHTWLDRETLVASVRRSIADLDAVRGNILALYGHVAGGSPAEHELGESLQAVRKALLRLRKARKELAQTTLPFASEGGDV